MPATTELNLGIARLMTGDFTRGLGRLRVAFSRQPLREPAAQPAAFPAGHGGARISPAKPSSSGASRGSVTRWCWRALLPEISREARACVIECAPKLLPLFARSFPDANVVAMTNPPHPGTAARFDYQVSLGGIARWRRRDLGDFPRARAHLVPPPERVRHWERRLAGSRRADRRSDFHGAAATSRATRPRLHAPRAMGSDLRGARRCTS